VKFKNDKSGMAVPLGQEKSQGNVSGHVPQKTNVDEWIKKHQNFLHFDGKHGFAQIQRGKLI